MKASALTDWYVRQSPRDQRILLIGWDFDTRIHLTHGRRWWQRRRSGRRARARQRHRLLRNEPRYGERRHDLVDRRLRNTASEAATVGGSGRGLRLTLNGGRDFEEDLC